MTLEVATAFFLEDRCGGNTPSNFVAEVVADLEYLPPGTSSMLSESLTPNSPMSTSIEGSFQLLVFLIHVADGLDNRLGPR